MNIFLHTVLTFPTAIFSFLLLLIILYWIFASVGLFDMDSADQWLSAPDADTGGFEINTLSGLLIKFGLDGVPIMLILSIMTFIAWFLSYFIDYFVLNIITHSILHYVLGGISALVTFSISLPITGIILRPFRNIFKKVISQNNQSLLGKAGVVRGINNNPHEGTALFEDGGAGLILHIRYIEKELQFNQKVILLKYFPEENIYLVASEDEFNGV